MPHVQLLLLGIKGKEARGGRGRGDAIKRVFIRREVQLESNCICTSPLFVDSESVT